MSSMSSLRNPFTRSIAARIAIAAMSSGRVADSFPFGALPTAVRTAETMTGELICPSQAPLLSRGGGLRGKRKLRSHLSPRRRGGADQENDFAYQHHPSRRYRVCFPLLG